MRQIILSILILCNCLAFAQTGTIINSKNADAIKNDSLKAIVRKFEEKQYPFTLAEIKDDEVIDASMLNQLLKLELEISELGLQEYYYGYVFYDKEFFGLVITHYYTPGAFGIENYFLELITVTYEGKVISHEVLSCFCNDTNMGSNDYYSTEPEIIFDARKIVVNEKLTHATLVEDESEEPFEDITEEVFCFDVDGKGKVVKRKQE